MNDPLPWHRAVWERLVARREQLPHAILLTGMDGLGQEVLAERLAQWLLCARPSERACGECRSCRLFAAATHPDLHVLQPETVFKPADTRLAAYAWRYAPRDKSKESKDSAEIRIDQVRALIESSQTRPQIAARKVVILSPAEAMNVNAANSLLKLLEEPPPDSQLLLVTSRPLRLPATVRSRCARIALDAPPRAEAAAWLAEAGLAPEQAGILLDLAGGSPLRARALGQGGFLELRARLLGELEALAAGRADPVGCAQRWKAQGGAPALDWLHTLAADLIRLGFGTEPAGLHNRDLAARLQPLVKGLHLKRLFDFLEAIATARNLFGAPLDELLLLEDALIRWSQLRTEAGNE